MRPDVEAPPAHITLAQLAGLLAMPMSTVYLRLHRGELPAVHYVLDRRRGRRVAVMPYPAFCAAFGTPAPERLREALKPRRPKRRRTAHHPDLEELQT